MQRTRETPTTQVRTQEIPLGTNSTNLTLTLQGEQTLQRRRVTFEEGTIDNEHMNKKKSKICCIYKKPRKPGESSSECESDCDVNNYEKK
jgi:protein phosphatase 1 regulatory subunit 11